MAQTPNDQKKKASDKPDAKKSDKIRVERFGDKGLDYITLSNSKDKAKK